MNIVDESHSGERGSRKNKMRQLKAETTKSKMTIESSTVNTEKMDK